MKKAFNITNEGLKELPHDDRDFALGGVYGTIDVKDVPTSDFIVAKPLVIKDQGDTDYCSAYAVTEVSEDQEGVELLPEYQFYSTKRITGDPDEWGADLRSACKSAVDFGSLPVQGFENMKGKTRVEILNPKSWPSMADDVACMHKKSTFFKVTGKYDVFDNIRCALWQHRDDKSTIVTGALWKSGWIPAVGGIIPDIGGDGFGHAFKIFGQKVINGEINLMAQLSGGDKVGDGGIYYFNRTIANRELGKYGVFMLKDLSREEAEYYLSHPFTKQTSVFGMFWAFITNLFKK